MAKMTVIYKTPKDIAAFEKHYFEVHVPLAKKLPGLIKYEINDGVIASTTGHTDTYRIANLYFDSMDAMRDAFRSEIGQQCAADRKILAPENEDVQIYLYDTKNV
ncbi:MAG: EthD family reductase [Flavipsychrobacter sp.]|nr:EthD family reductase [Flavipsychrobacter sp.]